METQGFTELSFSLLLWALLRNPIGHRESFWAGFALALAAANKPGNALMALALLVYWLRYHRDKLLSFCLPLFVFGSLVLFYNLYFFGHALGINPNPFLRGNLGERIDFSHSTMWHGLAGLLASPNRGLVIFIPWIVFSFWGAVRLWMEKTYDWGRYLVLGVVAMLIGHARFWGWWGGWCYGPRYLTDLLPFFAFFFIPVWPRIGTSSLLRATFCLATLVALWVQIVGAYLYRIGVWDARPLSVDHDTGRLWD